MSSQRGDEARTRAASAAKRVDEVEERLRALRAGIPSTSEDIDRAEQAVEAERDHSAAAHRRAAGAHRDSATSHQNAAELFESAGRPEEAAEHRRKAMLDEEAANDDASGA